MKKERFGDVIYRKLYNLRVRKLAHKVSDKIKSKLYDKILKIRIEMWDFRK